MCIGLCLHVEQQGWFPGTKCLVIWQKCLWRLHRPFWCHLDNWPFDFQFSIFCPQSSSVTSYEALIGQLVVGHILKSKSVRLLPKQTHVIFSNGSPHFQINRVKLKSKNPKKDSKFPLWNLWQNLFVGLQNNWFGKQSDNNEAGGVSDWR